jgi:hypothetical protein
MCVGYCPKRCKAKRFRNEKEERIAVNRLVDVVSASQITTWYASNAEAKPV